MFKPSLGLAYMLTSRFSAEGFYFGEDELDILSSIVEFASKVNPASVNNVKQEIKAFVNEMKLLEEGTRKDFIFNMSSKHYWDITG